MSGEIQIRLFGIFKKACGKPIIALKVRKVERLRDVVQKLAQSSPELERVLLDPELDDPRPNAIILVDGKEIGILKGLETEVTEGSEVVFLPVTHGG